MEITEIDNEALNHASRLLGERIGVYFPQEKWDLLKRGIKSASGELGFSNVNEFLEKLQAPVLTREHIETLASHLTVGETYFFRDDDFFRVLGEQILPELIKSCPPENRTLRIWSAGCSSGEEPYSIAILFTKLIPNIEEWSISIYGTDINPDALSKASRGRYTEWSFRGVSGEIRKMFFKKTDENVYILDPVVKKLATFTYHNLAVDPFPSLLNNTTAMNLIVCRNVLMYFQQEMADRIIGKFYNCLLDDGLLVVGPAEVSMGGNWPFNKVRRQGVTLLKKKIERPFISSHEAVDLQPALSSHEVAPTQPRDRVASTPEPEAIESAEREVVKFDLPKRFDPGLASYHHTRSDNQSGQMEITEESHPPDTVQYAEDELGTTLLEEVFACYEGGDYRLAKEKLLQIVGKKAFSKHGAAEKNKCYELLIRSCANLGNYADARNWCEWAIAEYKLDPKLHFLMAAIQQEEGDVYGAIETLKKTVYLDQDLVIAHFVLGNLKRGLGKHTEADKHFVHALDRLGGCDDAEIIPGSDGLSVGRLADIIQFNMQGER
ncbi:MAG: CheR family methyltransferase [bacterium]